MVHSWIVTKGVGWEVLGMGMLILRYGMVVEGVEIIDTGDWEMEVGTNVMGSWEEVVGMEELCWS